MLQDIDTIPFGLAGLVVVLQAASVCRSRRLSLLLRHQERCLFEELSHAHFLLFRTHLAHLVCLVRFFSSLEHLFLDLALHQLICAALYRRLVLLFILQAVTNLFHPLCQFLVDNLLSLLLFVNRYAFLIFLDIEKLFLSAQSSLVTFKLSFLRLLSDLLDSLLFLLQDTPNSMIALLLILISSGLQV